MTHSIKLSDEAYKILLEIAKDEGRSVTKQIEVWAKKLDRIASAKSPDDNLLSRSAYLEALEQAEQGDVVKIGTFESAEELDEILGI
ncbi:MAG: ParD-like family protein [Puniceicoccales bacterium]|nr:ParD-like family protein [Puniceicoccales bacterium]